MTTDRLDAIEARATAGTATLDDAHYLVGEVRRLRGVEDRLAALLTEPSVSHGGRWVSPLDALAYANPHVRAELARLRTAAAFTDDHVDEALALANAGRDEPRRRGLLRLVGR